MNAEERKYRDNLSNDNATVAGVAEKKEKKRGAILSEISVGTLCAIFGYLLGGLRLPFGTAPFGMALLCAADKKVPYIFAGVILSALGSDKPVVIVCSYVAALIIRVLVRMTLDTPQWIGDENGELSAGAFFSEMFSENVCLRMATSSVGIFIVGIYTLIEGGFLYYDLYGAIIGMVTAPTAVILTHGIFNRRNITGGFAHFSAALLAFGVVFAARAVVIYGVSLAAFGAMFATLYVCRKKGIIYGIAAGIICGLAYSPMLSPIFIFAALAFGALWRVSAIFASLSAFSVGIAWGLYVNGIGAITKLLPALFAASILFAVIDKLFLSLPLEKEVTEEKAAEKITCRIGDYELANIRHNATEQKIGDICGTFSEMSRFFYDLGEKMKMPLASDVKQICDNAFDACCANCKNKAYCWDENYTDTISAIASISAHVHKKGRVVTENIPASLRSICERLPDITDEINHNCSAHMKQLMLCDKTEIFALDYEAISDMLTGVMKLDESEYECDVELSRNLCERLEKGALGVIAAAVYGTRKKRIVISALNDESLITEKEKIRKVVADCCNIKLDEGNIQKSSDGREILIFDEKRRFGAEYAKRLIISGREEDFCGDTVNIFENEEDKFYSLISDGMGSGRDAALTSGICAMFIQKLLLACNRCDSVLRMLNGFLRNKGGGSMHECSATVDLMELDLMMGKASFYKSGAAPTYVFRSGSLFKLRSKTVPVGIIRELDTKKISFDVGDGDVIVMVSDGVTQGKEECPWLFDLLKKSVGCESLDRIAELVSERARNENQNDDISVVIIKVTKEDLD